MKTCRTVLLNNLVYKQNCKGLIHLKVLIKRNTFFVVLVGRTIEQPLILVTAKTGWYFFL